MRLCHDLLVELSLSSWVTKMQLALGWDSLQRLRRIELVVELMK